MHEIGMVLWRSKPQLVDRLFSFMWRQLAYMLYLAAIFNLVFEFTKYHNTSSFPKVLMSKLNNSIRNNDWSLSIHSGSGPHCSRSCRSRRRPAPGAAPWPWPRPSPPSRSWTRTWRRWARRPATSTCAAGTGAHPWQPSRSRTRHTLWIELATNLLENFLLCHMWLWKREGSLSAQFVMLQISSNFKLTFGFDTIHR